LSLLSRYWFSRRENHVATWDFETVNERLYPACRMVGYEGLEVINPDGGTEDAEAEAMKGRWKQEVRFTE
jgi:hypothetical protein